VRFLQFIAATWLALVCAVAPAGAERRLALVVGNGAYLHADKLTNPVNDARRMRDALTGLKFDVMYGENLDGKEMHRMISRFASRVQDADVALVYFAGHGSTFGDTSYVAPIDAEFSNLDDMPAELVTVEELIGDLRRAKSVRIAILDACRDNAVEQALKTSRGGPPTRGLAPPKNPAGLIIAYATQHGAVAADNAGSTNSPFTAALLANIATPGLDVKEMFFKVGSQVEAATSGRQRPEISVSMYEPYALVPTVVAPPIIMPPKTAGARCPEEGRLRSTDGRTSTYINFVNHTRQAIRTYWLNYEGHRQYYAEIQAGATYRQQTYLTHPWVVTDSSDNCLRVLMPEVRETTHSIF
jgi:hypothetical protein